MDRTAPPSAADSKPFVRARRIELEPVLFAASMIAMVVVVGLWQPFSKAEQTLVAEQTTQAVGTKPAH